MTKIQKAHVIFHLAHIPVVLVMVAVVEMLVAGTKDTALRAIYFAIPVLQILADGFFMPKDESDPYSKMPVPAAYVGISVFILLLCWGNFAFHPEQITTTLTGVVVLFCAFHACAALIAKSWKGGGVASGNQAVGAAQPANREEMRAALLRERSEKERELLLQAKDSRMDYDVLMAQMDQMRKHYDDLIATA